MGLLEDIWAYISGPILSAINGVQNWISPILNAVVDVQNALFRIVGDTVNSVTSWISSALIPYIATIIPNLQSYFLAVTNPIGFAINTVIYGRLPEIFNATVQFGNKTLQGITDYGGRTIQTVVATGSQTITALNHIANSTAQAILLVGQAADSTLNYARDVLNLLTPLKSLIDFFVKNQTGIMSLLASLANPLEMQKQIAVEIDKMTAAFKTETKK